ncbi:MAG: tRNA (adenosine(37)-N6)-threonylcarbamoyltransferase complex dimerization subunit type 1 TsaB [Cyanobacteriota bacterium]
MSAAASMGGGGWVLALHSSSEVLGVAAQPLGAPAVAPRMEAFPLGRQLSNALLPCVEAVLPAREWSQLARLAVATGPGGFTGTRLTVALARTLAQQLGLPLDGFSSFHLMARRLLAADPTTIALILSQELPRHGVVAGLYGADPTRPGGVAELRAPRLYRCEEDLTRDLGPHDRRDALPSIPADVAHLLTFSQEAATFGLEAPWAAVLPLYPTSPVEPS